MSSKSSIDALPVLLKEDVLTLMLFVVQCLKEAGCDVGGVGFDNTRHAQFVHPQIYVAPEDGETFCNFKIQVYDQLIRMFPVQPLNFSQS